MMGCSKKKYKLCILHGIFAVLFWGCLIQSTVVWGRERVSYTSVTI